MDKNDGIMGEIIDKKMKRKPKDEGKSDYEILADFIINGGK